MKLKRMLSLLASMAMMVTAVTSAMSVSAETVDTGKCGDLTWTLDSEGKLTISGNGAMASPNIANQTKKEEEGNDATKLFIDSKLGDYTDIYTYKKEHMEDIKEVEIKEGVTAIGFCAFYKMPNLVTVVLPKTISEFKGVGYDCGWGTNHTFSISAFASCAFAECTKLKNLTLAEGMTAIGSIAFYGCTSLESVRIPSTVLYENNLEMLKANNGWGPYSFMGCTSLKNITLPEGLTVIGAHVFRDTAVESVVIPSTVKEWNHSVNAMTINTSEVPQLPYASNCAFANCKKLSSVTFNDGITKIGNSSFVGCSSLNRVVIPKSVIEMKHSFAFSGLQEAYIEDGAQILPEGSSSSGFQNAFLNCTNLKKIEIPEGIDIDYSNAEWCKGCSSLQDIYLHGKEYMSARVNALNEFSKFHCYPDSNLFTSSSVSDERKANLEEDLSKARNTLNKKLEDARALNENDYTAESYAALKTAIENAEKFDESYTGVLPLQWAAEDISNAINSLVKKPAQDSVKPDTAKPSATTPNVKSQAQKNAENAMKQAKITKLTVKSKAKKKITVTWKKVSKANGYQVQVSTNKKFKKSKIILTKTTSKKKITIKKLKSKKTYFVRVRAYATYKDSNGKPQKVYSSWIKKTRKVKVK